MHYHIPHILIVHHTYSSYTTHIHHTTHISISSRTCSSHYTHVHHFPHRLHDASVLCVATLAGCVGLHVLAGSSVPVWANNPPQVYTQVCHVYLWWETPNKCVHVVVLLFLYILLLYTLHTANSVYVYRVYTVYSHCMCSIVQYSTCNTFPTTQQAISRTCVRTQPPLVPPAGTQPPSSPLALVHPTQPTSPTPTHASPHALLLDLVDCGWVDEVAQHDEGDGGGWGGWGVGLPGTVQVMSDWVVPERVYVTSSW